jgi:hypothetical protein
MLYKVVLPINDNINWTAAYLLAKKCTKSTKLIEFQFKFLHRRVPTNNFLFRIGLRGDEKCSFCHTSSESIIHLFWSCRQISHFWNKLTKWLKKLNLLPEIMLWQILPLWVWGQISLNLRFLSITAFSWHDITYGSLKQKMIIQILRISYAH